MNDHLTISTDPRGVHRITLNRPQVRNAFDERTVAELHDAFVAANGDSAVRVVVLAASGDTFCSGADVKWLRSMIHFDQDANYADALRLARLMQQLYTLDKPTVARVNGAAFGGALGLIACCDIAVADSAAVFAFSEVHLGIIPAVIAPYIINAIGQRQAQRLFLTAERFNAQQALEYGLVHQLAGRADLDRCVEAQVNDLLVAAPLAQRECKRLLRKITGVPEDLIQHSAQTIARLRCSAEGQEGLGAFLEKRKPNWR
jgi:methylglutaconyl-CoA hydratase